MAAIFGLAGTGPENSQENQRAPAGYLPWGIRRHWQAGTFGKRIFIRLSDPFLVFLFRNKNGCCHGDADLIVRAEDARAVGVDDPVSNLGVDLVTGLYRVHVGRDEDSPGRGAGEGGDDIAGVGAGDRGGVVDVRIATQFLQTGKAVLRDGTLMPRGARDTCKI